MKISQIAITASLVIFAGITGYYLASSDSAQTQNATASGKNAGEAQAGALSVKQQRSLQKQGWNLSGPNADKQAEATSFQSQIKSDELNEFELTTYYGGQPAYDGEPVTAYVKIGSSGKRLALTPNQNGEYPKVVTELGEAVEVRLAFTQSSPGDKIALSAQDGGKLHLGKMAGLLQIDEQRQLPFGFMVSTNPGIHRVSITTTGGEVKTLNFWAGIEHKLNTQIATSQVKTKP